MRRLLLAGGLLAGLACRSTSAARPTLAPDAERFVAAIERAHAVAQWRARAAVEMAITVSFRGETFVAGTFLFTPGVDRVRFTGSDGTTAVFDGRTVWAPGTDESSPMVRFQTLTWPHFAALPAKLRDSGTSVEVLGEGLLFGEQVPLAQLTFVPGVGETPDDWFALYRDPESDLLLASGYLLTFGKQPHEISAKDAHAIRFLEYREVDGIPFPLRWTFHDWNRAEGPGEDLIGEAHISSLRFVEAPPSAFAIPPDWREVPRP